MLILKIVQLGPIHGYGIAQRLRQISADVFQVQQGSLYPALQRLEKRKLIRAEWKETESGRQARVYQLTKSGKQRLATEEETWRRLSNAVSLVLRTAE